MSDIEARPYSKDYEITDAMFGAFRTEGGAKYFWKLWLWASLLFGVVYLVTLPAFVRAYARILSPLMSIDNTEAMDPEAMSEVMTDLTTSVFGIFPSLILMSIGALAVISVVRAAFYRRYFHGEEAGLFPFRLGGDEGRQFLAQLGYWGLFMLATILGVLVMSVIVGAAMGVAVAAESSAGAVIAGVLMIVLYLGFYVFLFWFGVKFAPAGALTGLRRQVHVLAARKVTKNRYWALLGSILVAGIFGYMTYYFLIIVGVIIGFGSLFTGDAAAAFSSDDPQAVMSALSAATQSGGFKVGATIGILLMSAGQAFYTLILLGPSAFFVRQWDESDPRDVFS